MAALSVIFFFIIKCSVLIAFSLLLQRYARKGIDVHIKNLAILRFFFVSKRTQLNACAVSQKMRINQE